MKKFFSILIIAIAVLAVASCNLSEIDEMGVRGLDVNAAKLEQGMTFATYPYAGTSYENTAEIVTFEGDRVSVGFGTASMQMDRAYGDWAVDKTGKKIIIENLAFYDKMSGRRYELLEAEIGKRSDGLYVLYLAYDTGSGKPHYDPAFVYVQYVTLQPEVSPWDNQTITIM